MTQPSDRFRVLLSNDAIVRRSHELARRIQQDYSAEPPLLVSVIEGARAFTRQLQKSLGTIEICEIRASSYGNATESSGEVKITPMGAIDAKGRDIILVEDIVDTGRTVVALKDYFRSQGARQCRVATLLTKPSRRVVEVDLDYVGFEIPDEFVIGFGMDHAGRYRELLDVVIYDAAVEGTAAQS
ncbi:MAG: hypoxanthine phosphoribosyltransferase [Planctomycetota bacterium]|nr:hypoxanthine phosphoribosyltransferase [Planctomycetota bacterium]